MSTVRVPCIGGPFILFLLASDRQPQHKVDYNGAEEGNRQDGRAEPVVEATLTTHPYTPRAPVESEERIEHSHHGNEGEEASGDLANAVAEVEKADG